MNHNQYNRWQGLAIAQFSVAVALISGLSVAGLGAGLSLLQDQNFPLTGWWRCAFALSQLFFEQFYLIGVERAELPSARVSGEDLEIITLVSQRIVDGGV